MKEVKHATASPGKITVELFGDLGVMEYTEKAWHPNHISSTSTSCEAKRKRNCQKLRLGAQSKARLLEGVLCLCVFVCLFVCLFFFFGVCVCVTSGTWQNQLFSRENEAFFYCGVPYETQSRHVNAQRPGHAAVVSTLCGQKFQHVTSVKKHTLTQSRVVSQVRCIRNSTCIIMYLHGALLLNGPRQTLRGPKLAAIKQRVIPQHVEQLPARLEEIQNKSKPCRHH